MDKAPEKNIVSVNLVPISYSLLVPTYVHIILI